MYLRAPRIPEATPPLQASETLSFAEQQRAIKRIRRVTKVTGAVVSLCVAVTAYAGDVHANQLREQAATVKLDAHDIETFDIGGATTSFVDGYGAMNANYLANKFGESVQFVTEGPIRSADFSDAPIEGSHLGDTVVEDARDTKQNRVSFFGFSTGGILATESATEIITDPENNLSVEIIFMAATPSGPQSLRDGEIEKIGALNVIADFPGAKNSSPVKWLISMASDYEQFNTGDPTDFFRVSAENWDSVTDHSEPGVGQLDDQALAIMNADFAHSFNEMSKMRGIKQMPVIVYLAAEDPDADTTVNNEAAYEEIRKAAEDAGIIFLVYKVPGAVHSVYNTPVESYQDVLKRAKDEIQSMVEKERLFLQAAQSFDMGDPNASTHLQ